MLHYSGHMFPWAEVPNKQTAFETSHVEALPLPMTPAKYALDSIYRNEAGMCSPRRTSGESVQVLLVLRTGFSKE